MSATKEHIEKLSGKIQGAAAGKYADTIEKVIRKGGTPAGMHISICVQEILDFLQIRPGQTGLDATLGYGGHTERMLERLEGQGHLHALDVDPAESGENGEKASGRWGYGEDILTVHLLNFAQMDQVARELEALILYWRIWAFLLCRSTTGPGFSYKTEGPLDLRMNQQKGISAAERLEHIGPEELVGMLTENADEPYAEEIAREITGRQRRGGKIRTTTQLREAIEAALSFLPAAEQKETVKKSCQRTFQALRIDVNNEYEVLYEFLEKLPEALRPGGRAAILTFHSGEDRLVKKSFKRYLKEGRYSGISEDAIRPSREECAQNSRARSTKMRWAVRAG